jgi:hypothetical protein
MPVKGGTIMKTFRTALVAACLLLAAGAAHAQARLIIQNQSAREMTVKVMRVSGAGDWLHTTTAVAPFGTQTVYFSETGTYFLKTMAVLGGRAPVYQKGDRFLVHSGPRGYSVITMTFTIREAATPQVLGGAEISKREFDRDSPVP